MRMSRGIEDPLPSEPPEGGQAGCVLLPAGVIRLRMAVLGERQSPADACVRDSLHGPQDQLNVVVDGPFWMS